MRVVVDREADALRLELADAGDTRRTAVAEGVIVLYDPAGRVAGIELRSVDPASLTRFTVEVAGLRAERPLSAPQPSPAAPTPPAPLPHTGPLVWDAEAEEAVLQVPFFSRGRHRLAASALARRQGLDRVTAAVVQAIGR